MTDTAPIPPAIPPAISSAAATPPTVERHDPGAQLAQLTKPRSPRGPAAILTDRVLVHATGDNALNLAASLPPGSGLVLSGKKAHETARALRAAQYRQPMLIDPSSYETDAATPERPFAIKDDGMFTVSLEEMLNAQLSSGAVAALTPTGYLHAGDTDSLKAAAKQVEQLHRDDVILTLPLDVAWLTGDHIASLIAILARLDAPKAVLLAAQFDPMERYKTEKTVKNLRRLCGEAGDLAHLRTDLTGFDALCHGAFTASIGTGGSQRHIVPVGQRRRSGNVDDQSPSVLYGDLMTFYRGSKIAQRFANHVAPSCADCNGLRLDGFLGKSESTAAHLHGIHTWSLWADQMRAQATLGDRATWWRNKCRLAKVESDAVNLRIGQDGAFAPSGTVIAWSELPPWATAPIAPRNSR
jgi:hypothetical protein